MTMVPSFTFFRKATSTSIPLLLLTFLSLSSAWAGAFNSGTNSPLIRQQRTFGGAPSPPSASSFAGSFLMKTSPAITARDPASPPSSPFLTLSTLLFLRGGQRQDEDTVTSDETASLDADIDVQLQRQYGSTQDKKSSDSDTSVDKMEMTDVESADGSSATTPPSFSSPLLSVIAPVSSLIRAAAALYTNQLTLRPILTKSLTAGIIFGLSDWCAQTIERDGKPSPDAGSDDANKLVLSRILSTFLVGFLIFGPAANAWYSMIFRVLPSTSLLSTLYKAALGQVFFGPAFTCVFFGAGMLQAGTFSLGTWSRKIRDDLPAVWASGLGFWPVVDFVSYKVIPVQWIPLFVNFCSFVWTIYLSLVANKGKGAEE